MVLEREDRTLAYRSVSGRCQSPSAGATSSSSSARAALGRAAEADEAVELKPRRDLQEAVELQPTVCEGTGALMKSVDSEEEEEGRSSSSTPHTTTTTTTTTARRRSLTSGECEMLEEAKVEGCSQRLPGCAVMSVGEAKVEADSGTSGSEMVDLARGRRRRRSSQKEDGSGSLSSASGVGGSAAVVVVGGKVGEVGCVSKKSSTTEKGDVGGGGRIGGGSFAKQRSQDIGDPVGVLLTKTSTRATSESFLEPLDRSPRGLTSGARCFREPTESDDGLWKGRKSNSTIDSETTLSPTWTDVPKNKSLLVPCIAVFSSNYNFTVLAAALFIMETNAGYKRASSSGEMASTLKMLCYGGAVFGQFAMGYVGDCVGRRKGMILTLSLVVVGAFCSATCSWGSPETVLYILCGWRFLLGVGNGGVYPLSAVSAAEGTASSKAEDRGPRVSIAYIFNVPGIIAPYILALILWNVSHDVEVNWRILTGAGCVSALSIMVAAVHLDDSDEYRTATQESSSRRIFRALANPEYWTRLMGTGWCWFMYDVTTYGILLIQPDITRNIWGEEVSVNAALWQSILLNAMGIPGAIFGILVVNQMGSKWLQFWGFVGLALSATVMAATVHALRLTTPWAQMLMLAIVNFFISWGASITTFILPSEVFPPECRATYNGISAAMGKIGAVVGIYSLKAVMRAQGVAVMMVVAALVSLLGAVLTWFFVGQVPKTWRGAISQCFGSLLGCIPFCDPRDRLGWGK